jgi:hypothetical protein
MEKCVTEQVNNKWLPNSPINFEQKMIFINLEKPFHSLANLTFRQTVRLFPFAFSLHVLEEWYGQFPLWANKYASPEFTTAEYIRIHLLSTRQ